jgi:hypothetical protein
MSIQLNTVRCVLNTLDERAFYLEEDSMSKKLLLITVIIILIAPGLIAAGNNKPKENVYIRPWSGEVTINLRTQEGVARMGWGNCSAGLAADWIENSVVHLELYQGPVLLQTVDTEDARWITVPTSGDPFVATCMHVGQPYNAYWDFARLRLNRPGDYILRFSVETTVPMTDGADFGPADGVMDLYPAQLWFDQEEVLIHVVR